MSVEDQINQAERAAAAKAELLKKRREAKAKRAQSIVDLAKTLFPDLLTLKIADPEIKKKGMQMSEEDARSFRREVSLGVAGASIVSAAAFFEQWDKMKGEYLAVD